MTNTASNPQLDKLSIAPVTSKTARKAVLSHHYMQTYPQGAKINFGVFMDQRLVGIAVFGYSSGTESKVRRICGDLERERMIEMQRLWISDQVGHNAESYVLSKIMRTFRMETRIAVVITHAGGCKNDCGFVYQSSAWLYFGSEPCNDFYLTDSGEYRNMIASMRFARVSTKGKTRQQIGEELFGPGHVVEAHRYTYVYPVIKSMRRKLEPHSLPYPKESEQYRYNQEWVTQSR